MDDDVSLTRPQPQRPNWKFWESLLGLVCCVLVGLGIQVWRELDPIVEPTPARLDIQATVEQRAALTPQVRELLEKIEAGAVSGEMAREFRVLDESDKTQGGKGFRTYLFSLDGHTGDLEGHPVIYVQVQLKTGRIIHCGTAVPTY
jgi:hypothetical protein